MSDPRKPRTGRGVTTPVVVALVAAAVALIMAGVPLLTSGGSDAKEDSAGPAATAPSSESDPAPAGKLVSPRRIDGDPVAMGDVDAPVVLVVYSDFQCPFCGKFARETEPGLIKKYVETGTMRIEWRDFPYLGPESLTAAHAARAAALQGKFWPMHDAFYAEKFMPNSGRITQQKLDEIATKVGLDLDRFHTDMYSAKVSGEVQNDFQQGQSYGVTGTPTFLVNDRPIVGAQPAAVFENAIEQAAAAAR